MGKRVILYPDGTISAVWTTATDNAFANRGTGYNHNDKTNWMTVADGATPRIETKRTGWPSIALIGGNKEVIIAHSAEDGGFIMSTNSVIGNTAFTQQAILTQTKLRPLWARIGTDGLNYIHVISNYADSSAPSDPPAPKVNGIKAPMTYSRSSDGGQTWDFEHTLLPGYDSTRWAYGGGDNYAIDVRDSIVAIVTGRLGTDVSLWKSYDNGTTFTHYFVDSLANAPLKQGTLALDTPFCSDGTMDVLIDANGKCHVWYGLGRVLKTDSTDDSYSFFPGTAGLMYWNEGTTEPGIIAYGAMFDRDQDGGYSIEKGTYWNLENGNIPSDIYSVARLGNTSVLRQPSAGIDADGNLYVAFSMPVEGALDDNSLNYRAIYIMYSKDGGATWHGPQCLTKILNKENDFPSIARRVNEYVHLIFQQDDIPGTNLANNSASANNHPISENGNDIMYAAIPKQDVLDSIVGNLWSLNVQEIKNNSQVFVVSQNVPNPFSGQTDITIYLNGYTPVLNVEVKDLTGKIVISNKVTNLNQGNHVITLDGTNLSSGVYFYTLTAGNNTITRKMIVE
ncbi:MAG: T9SS type A sorting domain-containing protein [Bacteroidia bacterium]|nr:T9SS type A sorting domain-containing protein [Bacteroidia bacterium]